MNAFTLYRRLLSLIPIEGLTVVCREYDYESRQHYKATEHLSPAEAVRNLREVFTHKRKVDVKGLAALSTLDDCKQAIGEGYEAQGVTAMLVGTAEEAEAFEAEEERQRLEKSASRIAASLGVRIDSFEFITALEAKMDSERSHREGMREDGLCIGFGVSYEQWQDDFNYSQGQEAGYSEILDFLHTYCPLLIARYEESKLRVA